MSTTTNEIACSNVDILTEILHYLPPKPLIRFKSVSKQWYSLISSRHFCRKHASKNAAKPAVSGIICRKTQNLKKNTTTTTTTNNNGDKYCDYDFISLKEDSSSSSCPSKNLINFISDPTSGSGSIKILQSCNGLLLLRCTSLVTTDNNCSNYNYHVCNPTTNQHLTLPCSILDDAYHHKSGNSSSVLSVNLAYDPLKSPHYKVICLRKIIISTRMTNDSFSSSSSSYCQIDIYSSEKRVWRKSGDPFIFPPSHRHMIFSNGVFSYGAIHWMSVSGYYLLHFKVEEEQIVETCLPADAYHFAKRRFRYFGESCGRHLHLIDIVGSRTTKFNVFEMKTDYFSADWISMYEVDLNEVLSAYPEMVVCKPAYLDNNNGTDHDSDHFYYAFLILTVVREEGEDGHDESRVLLQIPGKIVSYKFKDRSFKTVRDLTSSSDQSSLEGQFRRLDAYQYIETLACV